MSDSYDANVQVSRTGQLTLKNQTAAFPVLAGLAVGNRFPEIC
jgi:hypothetical protein